MADQTTQNEITTLPREVNPAGLTISQAQDNLMARVLGAVDKFVQSDAATQAVSQPVHQTAPQAAPNQPAPQTAEKGPVPYDRFAETVAAKNAALAEAAALREKTARLEAEARAAHAANKANERLAADPILKDEDGKQEVDPKTLRVAQVMAEEYVKQAIGASPAELQAMLAERRVATELGIGVNSQQAQAIASVCQQTGLSPSEALLIASTRNPSLFPAQDARGPNPTVHHQTSPSSTQQPRQDSQQPRSKQILEALRGVPPNVNGFQELAGEALFDRIGSYFGAPPRT